MDDTNIAYCGVDCAACEDFSTKRCPGCRQTEWDGEDVCMPVACCEKKGIPLCGNCAAFPCEDMRAFYAESASHEQAYRRMRSLRGD